MALSPELKDRWDETFHADVSFLARLKLQVTPGWLGDGMFMVASYRVHMDSILYT
jgi:hypothetical protein